MWLTCFRNRYQVSWPKQDQVPQPAQYLSQSAVFETAHKTDLHFSPYYAPVEDSQRFYRLNSEAVGKVAWFMVGWVVDVDLPEQTKLRKAQAEKAGIVDPNIKLEIDAWFDGEKPKLRRLFESTDIAVAYRSKSGGYRLIWWYSNPEQIHSPSGLTAWRRYYIFSLMGLYARFGIIGDPNCADATHIFRAPKVTLDDGTQTIGQLLWPMSKTNSVNRGRFFPTGNEVGNAKQELAKVSKSWQTALNFLFPPPPPPPQQKQPNNAPGYIRAVAYARSRPPSIQGADGNTPFWMTAVTLTKCFGLSEAEAVEVIAQHFNPRCKPPWSQREIERAVRNAAQSNFTPRLWHESYHVSMIAFHLTDQRRTPPVCTGLFVC